MLSIGTMTVGFASALLIVIDDVKLPQQMLIMNVVWPVTSLFFGPQSVGILPLQTILDPDKEHSGHERRSPIEQATRPVLADGS